MSPASKSQVPPHIDVEQEQPRFGEEKAELGRRVD